MTQCDQPTAETGLPAAGVPLDLAQARAQQLQDVVYKLFFNIPSELAAPIPASMELSFSLAADSGAQAHERDQCGLFHHDGSPDWFGLRASSTRV